LIGFWFKVLVKELSNFQDMELENQTGWGPNTLPEFTESSLVTYHVAHNLNLARGDERAEAYTVASQGVFSRRALASKR
jgi:hypothetical protein